MIHSLVFVALWFGFLMCSPDIKLVYNGETVSFLVLLILGLNVLEGAVPSPFPIQLEHLFKIKSPLHGLEAPIDCVISVTATRFK